MNPVADTRPGKPKAKPRNPFSGNNRSIARQHSVRVATARVWQVIDPNGRVLAEFLTEQEADDAAREHQAAMPKEDR